MSEPEEEEEPESVRAIREMRESQFEDLGREDEEEAWTEEYFKKQDCGTVVGEPPTYQWVLYSKCEPYDTIDSIEVLGTFCKEGYAKLYRKWMVELGIGGNLYIEKTINNPPKPKELQNV
jgi:hypothetical protein